MSDLAKLTTTEAEAAIASASIAILPTGAIEQHGPHLELRCDWAIATAMAQRLSCDLGDGALLLPGIAYGCSEHHSAFPGTVSLRFETYRALLVDVALSLKRQGISKVLVVNGHGGNMEPTKLTARELRRDHGVLMAHAMWAGLSADVLAAKMVGRDLFNHACETETSIAMHLVPEIVRPIPESVGWRASANGMTDPPRAWVDLPTWFHQWTDDGALGDPRAATAEFGQEIIEPGYERLLAFARYFIDLTIPANDRSLEPEQHP